MGGFGRKAIEFNKARQKREMRIRLGGAKSLVLACGQPLRDVAGRRGKPRYIEPIEKAGDAKVSDIVSISRCIVGNADPLDNCLLRRTTGAHRCELAKRGVSSYG